MKMSFGPPARTGWDSREEYMDVFCEEAVTDLADRCNGFLPEGLRVVEVVELGDGVAKLANSISAAKMMVALHKADLPEGGAGHAKETNKYKDKIARRFTHNGGDIDTNGKPPEIIDVTITNGGEHIRIEYTSTMLSGKIVTPDEVVAEITGDVSSLRYPLRVTRLAQYVGGGGEYHSPMSQGVVRKQS